MTQQQILKYHQVCRKAVETFGWEKQSLIAIEEMSELQKEIIKKHRGQQNEQHLAEEIADVQVMLEQLVIMFGISEEVERELKFKMDRLERKIEGRAT